jgi:hypothetical protein
MLTSNLSAGTDTTMTLVIEKIKYDALVARASMFGTVPVYINSTPVGVWSFRLTELPEPTWEERQDAKDYPLL